MHSMGRVRRSLQLIESGESITLGKELFQNGKKVGLAKTSLEDQGRYVGLALVSNTASKDDSIQFGSADSEQVVTIFKS